MGNRRSEIGEQAVFRVGISGSQNRHRQQVWKGDGLDFQRLALRSKEVSELLVNVFFPFLTLVTHQEHPGISKDLTDPSIPPRITRQRLRNIDIPAEEKIMSGSQDLNSDLGRTTQVFLLSTTAARIRSGGWESITFCLSNH